MQTIFLIIALLLCNVLSAKEEGFVIEGEMPQDHSLLKGIQEMTPAERMQRAPEYAQLLQRVEGRIEAFAKAKMMTQELLDEELSAEEALELFGPCLDLSYRHIHPLVIQALLSSFCPQFYFVKRSFKALVDPAHYFSQDELEEIYQTACRIVEATCPNDTVISLGQSPAYIVVALVELISSDEKSELFRRIYKVPFSGAPDYSSNNFHYKKYKLSNLTTPSALAYFKEIARQRGISPLQIGVEGNVYVLDLIGTGGSVASFLKIMVNWYKSLGLALPEFKLLDVSVAERNFKNSTRITLPVGDGCSFIIDRTFVHTSASLSDKLDYTEGEDRVEPPFGALQWKPEYSQVFSQYPNAYAKGVMESVREYCRRRQLNDSE